jgi:hypothetical protein
MIIHAISLLDISGVGPLLARSQTYLDPGSGSFILQILVASLMGALLYMGIRWKQFRSYLRRRFSKDKEIDDDPSQPK